MDEILRAIEERVGHSVRLEVRPAEGQMCWLLMNDQVPAILCSGAGLDTIEEDLKEWNASFTNERWLHWTSESCGLEASISVKKPYPRLSTIKIERITCPS